MISKLNIEIYERAVRPVNCEVKPFRPALKTRDNCLALSGNTIAYCLK